MAVELPEVAVEPLEAVELYEPPSPRRTFAPSDVVRFVIGVVLVVGGGALADVARSTIRGLESDLLRAFGLLPDQFEDTILQTALVATSVVPTVVLVYLLIRRQFRLSLLLLGASLLASAGMLLADSVVLDRGLGQLLGDLVGNDDTLLDPIFPDSRALASTTAVVTVAAPFLSRRWKRALWWSVALLVFLRLIAVRSPAFDFVLALGVGTIVGSGLLLIFGTPRAEPRPRELLDALRAAGYSPRRITRPDQDDVALHYRFAEMDGTEREVSLRTPDERDADLLARLYGSLRYRSSEVASSYGSLKRRLEHEALLSSFARRAGVRTIEVERIGTTAGGSAFVVRPAVATRPATADDLDEPHVLDDLWHQVRALHDRAGIAHRRLALEAFAVDAQGRVWLHDFDEAQTAPLPREVARDIAQLLVETALIVGSADAVAAAVRTMGADQVAPALRMLQPLALPPSTRRRAKERHGLLDELRDAVNEATGEPDLQLEDLERIKPRTLLIIAASTLAFYSVLPQLANIDATVRAFGNADPGWIAFAVAASAASYVFAAIGFQGAVADPLPFLPNLRAQVSTAFAGLVGPGGAGGFALTARFLERAGVKPAEAGASVTINVVAGFAVHVTLMVAFFVRAGTSGLGEFSFPDSATVVTVLAVVFLVVGLMFVVGPVRRRVLPRMITALRTSAGQIGRVFQNPSRVIALFGGSLGVTASYMVGIVSAVHAFGGGLSVAQIGAAYLGAVAIATVAPTPGGLGALESAMIAGFTAFGLDAGIAVSATLTFRLATFWFPILPGWLCTGWMQRNDEI